MAVKPDKKISNAVEVIHQLRQAGFQVNTGDTKVVNTNSGYNSIVGRRNKPLIIKY